MRRIPLLVMLTGAFAGAASAQVPVAIVEEVKGNPVGVEFMDYLVVGRVIQLADRDTLVIGYMKSCFRETVTGGTIHIGQKQSEVEGGVVWRIRTRCDRGHVRLQSETADQTAVTVYRESHKSSRKPAPKPQVTLYGMSPFIEAREGGLLTIRRVNGSSDFVKINLSKSSSEKKVLFDFAATNEVLELGGIYQATLSDQTIIFKIDKNARPGRVPIIGRLLRFEPASIKH